LNFNEKLNFAFYLCCSYSLLHSFFFSDPVFILPAVDQIHLHFLLRLGCEVGAVGLDFLLCLCEGRRSEGFFDSCSCRGRPDLSLLLSFSFPAQRFGLLVLCCTLCHLIQVLALPRAFLLDATGACAKICRWFLFRALDFAQDLVFVGFFRCLSLVSCGRFYLGPCSGQSSSAGINPAPETPSAGLRVEFPRTRGLHLADLQSAIA
jgi:hypothetical protein